MSDYIHSEEFMNWVKGVTILKITKDGAAAYVKGKMQEFVNDLEHKVKSDEGHFIRFLTKVTVVGRVKKKHLNKHDGEFKYKIDSPCTECNEMFEKLQDNLEDGYRFVRWKCHDSSSTISAAVYWWILSKIYISYKVDSSLGPKDVDPLAVFTLMTLCKLFTAVKLIVVCLIELRNKLMHSKDNCLSAHELEEAFENSKIFLSHKDVGTTSEDAMKELEKLKQKRLISVGVDAECHELVREALILKKQCLEYDMEMARSEDKPIDRFDSLLRHTNSEIVKETEKVYKIEKRKTDEIQNLKIELDRKTKDVEFERSEKQKVKLLYERVSEKERELQNRNNDIEAMNRLLIQKIQSLEDERLNNMEKNEYLKRELVNRQEQLDQVTAQNNEDIGMIKTCVATAAAGGMIGGVTGGIPGAGVGLVLGPAVGVARATIKQYRN